MLHVTLIGVWYNAFYTFFFLYNKYLSNKAKIETELTSVANVNKARVSVTCPCI